MILETMHSALTIDVVYVYLINSARNPLLVFTIRWDTTGVICIVEVHCFYPRKHL